MALALKEAQAAAELAEKLYSFLPGTPHPYADKNLSFPGVAARLGLAQFWPGGSKGPAISHLLAVVLERERSRFCPLIVAVIQNGIVYRKRKDPVTRAEIDSINALLIRLGFKIPKLYDPEFLDALSRGGNAPLVKADRAPDAAALTRLQKSLMDIGGLAPVNRGFAFEEFIKDLFELFGLAPKGAFRLIGEQIDGSFDLDGEIYLLEARWRSDQAAIGDLLGFSGKVQGKAAWSRGLFLSYAGFSDDALKALGQGRRTEIVGMDGLDLYHVLSSHIDLKELLRRKIRRAAETNRFFVPARELFSGLI